MTTKQIQRENMLEAYKKAVTHIVVGSETEFELAAKNHHSDYDPKGGVKKLQDEPQFDQDRNQLKYSVVGSNGGEYILYVNFTDRRVYHAHVNQPNQQGEVFVIKINK